MKLIHIVSSVVIFSLSVLATNDWDCRGNTVYAYIIDRETADTFTNHCTGLDTNYCEINAGDIFEAKFQIAGSNPPGARVEVNFNKDFIISFCSV
ncbi:CELP0006 Effector like protein [Blumeria hordei DH14]|uniref:CELP0006 Effector like protein n=1 Tax=Blumeria graminis f. sp. hordei (strain DH14) TaxID=546991 RepID=N1J8L1_BLUG1|nr:CELP0006 Effector like protein [Blumeria hordei DH14]